VNGGSPSFHDGLQSRISRVQAVESQARPHRDRRLLGADDRRTRDGIYHARSRSRRFGIRRFFARLRINAGFCKVRGRLIWTEQAR